MTDPQRRRHVAIVGINYAPEQTGIAPYTTAMAERIAADGALVSVITGMPHYPHWRVADEYRRKGFLEEERNGVRVLRFASYVPSRQSAMRRAAFEGSFLLSAVRALRRIRPPDAVLGVIPALSDGVLARLLGRRFGVPYGLIFQDVMGPSAEQSGISGGGRVAATTRSLEGWAAREARVVAPVSHRFVPYLESLGVEPSRIMDLPNWTHVPRPRGDRQSTRARFGWAADNVIVLHAGNMGLKQGLDQVLAAAEVAGSRGLRVRFAFVGEGNQRRRLQRQADGQANVEFHPLEPEKSFPDVLAAADVLLVSERASAVDMSLPSKLTSYFASGTPVLAAVPSGGATAEEIQRCGGGIVVPPDEPEELVAAALRLASNGGLSHSISEAGQRYVAQSLGAPAALERVTDLVSRLLDRQPPKSSDALRSPSPVGSDRSIHASRR